MDHAQDCTDWKPAADLEPRFELLPRPAVHPDLAPFAAVPARHEHGAAATVQIAFLEGERFADPQSGAPEQYDQRTKAVAFGAIASRAHHGDDLLDRRWIGWVLLALVRGGRPRW